MATPAVPAATNSLTRVIRANGCATARQIIVMPTPASRTAQLAYEQEKRRTHPATQKGRNFSPQKKWNLILRLKFRSEFHHEPLGLRRLPMNGIIYIVGLIVVVMFILSFLGLR